VSAQTVLPALWVVVDDGSTDETPAILEEYRAKLPYLRVVRKADRSQRAVGLGSSTLSTPAWTPWTSTSSTTCAKLDLNLDLPPCYFERLMVRMESDPRIGTTSGKPWFRRPVRLGADLVVLATRGYRGRPARSYCHGARRRSPGAGCPTLAVPGQPAPSS